MGFRLQLNIFNFLDGQKDDIALFVDTDRLLVQIYYEPMSCWLRLTVEF